MLLSGRNSGSGNIYNRNSFRRAGRNCLSFFCAAMMICALGGCSVQNGGAGKTSETASQTITDNSGEQASAGTAENTGNRNQADAAQNAGSQNTAGTDGSEDLTAILNGHEEQDEVEFTDFADAAGTISFDTDYKNITFEKADLEVTEDDIQEALDELVQEHVSYEETDRAAQAGDRVNIDLTGTVDGKKLYEETGFNLVIGSGSLPEIESVLTGCKAGDKTDCDVAYPEDYGDPDLDGKTVHFALTVNSVNEPIVPEFDDAFAALYTSCADAKSYRESLQETLAEQKKADAVKDWIADHAVMTGYSDEVYEQYKQELISWYETAAQLRGTTVDNLFDSLGYGSEEGFLAAEDTRQTIEDNIRIDMAYAYIARQENLTATYGAFAEYAGNLAVLKGYQNVQELCSVFTEEELLKLFRQKLVTDLVMESASES